MLQSAAEAGRCGSGVHQGSKKRGTGCAWRETGEFLETMNNPGKRKQNAFSNFKFRSLKTNKILQTSASAKRSGFGSSVLPLDLLL